jgi:hypothetical protein
VPWTSRMTTRQADLLIRDPRDGRDVLMRD